MSDEAYPAYQHLTDNIVEAIRWYKGETGELPSASYVSRVVKQAIALVEIETPGVGHAQSEHDLSRNVSNALRSLRIQGRLDNRPLSAIPDGELLRLPNIGAQGLKEVRRVFPYDPEQSA